MRLCVLLMLGLALLFQACSEADTLADESPVEVAISANPTFSNGIGELLDLKCGYCHAHPLPDLAPDDVVTDLDLTTYATRVQDGQVIRGADGIGRFLRDGVLDHALDLYVDSRDGQMPIDVRQMPLDYGTPVTDTEKQALLQWVEAGLPFDETSAGLEGNATAGAPLWGSCNYCHGLSGEGLDNGEGRWLGPPLSQEAVTVAKIKSMWLWSRVYPGGSVPEPMSDQQAADLRAYIFSLLSEGNKLGHEHSF